MGREREDGRERRLEDELRELGARVEYPSTPDLARTVRQRIEVERPPRRVWSGRSFLSPRWAVAAAILLVALIPILSPGARQILGDVFLSGQASSAGGASGGTRGEQAGSERSAD